jgi:hypothetical protein
MVMRVTARDVWKGGVAMAVAIGLAWTPAPAGAKPHRAAAAGDVNGDGRVDVIAGLHLLKARGKSETGGVVVYFGGSQRVSGTNRITTLTKTTAGENLGRVLSPPATSTRTATPTS